MAPDSNDKRWNRIPIRFVDSENEGDASLDPNSADMETLDPDIEPNPSDEELELDPMVSEQKDNPLLEFAGGPVTAELVATRSELRRVQEENVELKDRLARRQADFENYRKRIERERSDTYNRVVADVAAKLLGVLDNLKRALEAEASVEATESDEFRHFLSGVDLVYKQLAGVLEALGVKQIVAVGEHFNPHIHEAVLTEATDEFEPDTVIQEIRAGYRLGDKLIRPALVKVATRT
ncbi:MAG TPA: nucleotide exchange factor GrpE [Pyrinomonadaceae bacterium]|jgi:molecular chaperone GrpE|nr:nucleotide exchange factor GrpE [Pyrinomonadaceae bacterium]